jgi:GTP-binding protein Era
MSHKAGFVNIIGNPNVGKSTLTNRLVGEKLSIITHKAQTTRHRIFGILNDPNFQMVISDTPGVIKPNYKLQESMMDFVREVFEDADVLLYVIEPGAEVLKDEALFEKLTKSELPLIVVINKVDLSNQEKIAELVTHFEKELPRAEIYPISALNDFGVDQLRSRLIELLPENPPFFDKEQITDKTERFIVSEKIREKILENYKKEIPYSVEVIVEEFKEQEDIIRIRSLIIVSRESQKGIIIGHQGKSLKRVGTQARRDLENFFGKKIYLEIFVKVNKDWRNNDVWLKRYGYKH